MGKADALAAASSVLFDVAIASSEVIANVVLASRREQVSALVFDAVRTNRYQEVVLVVEIAQVMIDVAKRLCR